jgi:hypothetical protein
VALVGTDVFEECITSIIRVTRIGEIEATLTVSSNRNTLRRHVNYSGIYSSETSVLTSGTLLRYTSEYSIIPAVTLPIES